MKKSEARGNDFIQIFSNSLYGNGSHLDCWNIIRVDSFSDIPSDVSLTHFLTFTRQIKPEC